MENIFKAYDIRGIYNEELTNQSAYLIGYYFIKYTKIKTIKISSDTRLSSNSLAKFLIKGIIDANAKPIYQGVSSTPNFYYSLFKETNHGIMITASHNPKEYNGFKFILNSISFDSRNGLLELKKIISKDEDNIQKKINTIQTKLESLNINEFIKKNNIEEKSQLQNYVFYLVNKYESLLNKEEQKVLNEINICFDFSSGVSSLALFPFLKEISLNFSTINQIPDGEFPFHSPDPSKQSKYLQEQTHIKTDLYIIFDGDGDRIVLYDKNGEKILPDHLIAILIDYFSKNSNHFVIDLRASRILQDICRSNNIKLDLLRVGRSFYQDFMKANNCTFGAELSGHLFFKEFNYFDNPDIAIIYILKIIAQQILNNNKNFSITDLTKKYQKYYKLEEKNLIVNNASKTLEIIKNKYKDYLTLQIDGYSFDLNDFWFNIRKSNTEPKIRINFEGKNKENTIKEYNNLINFIKKI